MNSQRWTYHRCGSKGQNTLLYNQSNQLVTASPTVKHEIGENDSNSYWMADLTSAYEGVSSVRRGLRLLDGRTAALIQDEIFDAAAGSQWRMHTTAIVTLSEDNTVAGMFAFRSSAQKYNLIKKYRTSAKRKKADHVPSVNTPSILQRGAIGPIARPIIAARRLYRSTEPKYERPRYRRTEWQHNSGHYFPANVG